MKHVSILLVFLSSFCAHAQHELSIKLTPLQTLHPEVSMLPVSIEYQFNRIGIEYEHGFKTPSYIFNWNDSKIDLNYFRARLSGRYYFNSTRNQFIGLSYSYLPQDYSRVNNWYTSQDNRYAYSQANISIVTRKTTLIYGLKFNLSKVMTLDIITGLGLSSRETNYQTTNETLLTEPEQREHQFFSDDRTPGKISNSGHYLFNLKIGYKLISSKEKR